MLRQPIERPFGLHRAAIQDQPEKKKTQKHTLRNAPVRGAIFTTRSAWLTSTAWRPTARYLGRAPFRLGSWAGAVLALTGRLADGVAEPTNPSMACRSW